MSIREEGGAQRQGETRGSSGLPENRRGKPGGELRCLVAKKRNPTDRLSTLACCLDLCLAVRPNKKTLRSLGWNPAERF